MVVDMVVVGIAPVDTVDTAVAAEAMEEVIIFNYKLYLKY